MIKNSMVITAAIIYTILCVVSVHGAETVNVEFAFDYSLTYQISAGCDITTNQLVVESTTIGSPAARRVRGEWFDPNLDHKVYARAPQSCDGPPEYGYANDPIYDGSQLEVFVGMSANPSDELYYLLSTNSSIYNSNGDRTILHLDGCKITKTDAWSISFDPVTDFLHVFGSTGDHFLVNVSSGTCTRTASVQKGVVIVGASYAVNTVSRTYSLFALDKATNSFGSLNPNTGVYSIIKTVVGVNVSDYFFGAYYYGSSLKVLFAQGQEFYNFNTDTGKLSSGYNYNYGRNLLTFCFPPANYTGTISPSFPSSPTSAPSTKAPTTAPTHAPATKAPTTAPTHAPATKAPTTTPTHAPATKAPTTAPPTHAPATKAPTTAPTAAPTISPKSPYGVNTGEIRPTHAPTDSESSSGSSSSSSNGSSSNDSSSNESSSSGSGQSPSTISPKSPYGVNTGEIRPTHAPTAAPHGVNTGYGGTSSTGTVTPSPPPHHDIYAGYARFDAVPHGPGAAPSLHPRRRASKM